MELPIVGKLQEEFQRYKTNVNQQKLEKAANTPQSKKRPREEEGTEDEEISKDENQQKNLIEPTNKRGRPAKKAKK